LTAKSKKSVLRLFSLQKNKNTAIIIYIEMAVHCTVQFEAPFSPLVSPSWMTPTPPFSLSLCCHSKKSLKAIERNILYTQYTDHQDEGHCRSKKDIRIVEA